MAPPSIIQTAIGELAFRVALDPELVQQLGRTYLSEEREKFITVLYNLLPRKYHHIVKDIWPLFIGYCK